MNEWLPKRLETVTNACMIAQILIRDYPAPTAEKLLPTILEYMFATAQEIIDENCVKE